jgi:hypothetical protein
MPPLQHISVSPTVWSCGAQRVVRCSMADGEPAFRRLACEFEGAFLGSPRRVEETIVETARCGQETGGTSSLTAMPSSAVEGAG